MTNLATRVITAIVLIAVIIVAMFVLPPPAASILFGGFFVVAAWEWSGFFSKNALPFRLAYVLLILALTAIPFVIPASEAELPKVLYVAIFYWVLVWLAFALKVRIKGTGWTMLAGLFALLPAWYSITLLLKMNDGYQLFLACVMIVAAADIGAYFTGKTFGKRKLAPTISPGKTWEGFFGGMISAALIMVAVSVYFDAFHIGLALLGFFIAGASVLGDLWVSSFKRMAGLKDSGKILPGHGGVLDRVDGLIAALPLFTVTFAAGGF